MMKARFINEEENNFIRSGDPIKSLNIGLESEAHKKKVFNNLKTKILFIVNNSNPEEKIIDNILILDIIAKKLNKLGVSYKNMIVYNNYEIRIKNSWQVISSNTVVSNCLSEEDAKNLFNAFKSFEPNEMDYNTDLRGSFPGFEKFKIKNPDDTLGGPTFSETSIPFLDALAENRKKYKLL